MSKRYLLTDQQSAEVSAFLKEDIGTGDITASIVPEGVQGEAVVITRESMVLCGQAWFDAVFRYLNPDVNISWQAKDGSEVSAQQVLCTLRGSARALLTGERTALNLLQTLSATATVAKIYSSAISGTGCKILDTRKTIPGLRLAQKYAVTCGGCYNHRMGLYDGILIKENHIMAAGSIALAVQKAKQNPSVMVEVEVESRAEFLEACAAHPDRIMLDNFNLEDMRFAVDSNTNNIELEASGNITLDNIRPIAETGVDFISVGALTKNVRAIDLSMRISFINR